MGRSQSPDLQLPIMRGSVFCLQSQPIGYQKGKAKIIDKRRAIYATLSQVLHSQCSYAYSHILKTEIIHVTNLDRQVNIFLRGFRWKRFFLSLISITYTAVYLDHWPINIWTGIMRHHVHVGQWMIRKSCLAPGACLYHANIFLWNCKMVVPPTKPCFCMLKNCLYQAIHIFMRL